jgi:hypothetical protein
MSSSFYFFLFVALIILGLFIIFIIQHRKKSRAGLYCEGIRNENDGRYNLAIHNYEEALDEIRSPRMKRSLIKKITGRIKILRTMIEYEKNFQVRIEV